jgi:hypothetical protein
MEGQATVAQDREARRRDLALIALLLLVAIALRAWHLSHTEVSARDSIGFIRYAWQLRHHSWIATLRDPAQMQHPGYPLTILALSYPVSWLSSGREPDWMQFSAQLASSLASVLLVIPAYLLGRELFNRGVGFWSALLFQCLPASGRVFADGLSEGVFLLFAVTALYGAVRAFSGPSPLWFAGTGFFGGLAYLTRPEGALIVAATGLVLLVVQGIRSRRAPWRTFLACGVALVVAAAVAGGPLVAITGKLTVKPSPRRVFFESADARPHTGAIDCDAEPLFAVWLGADDGHARAQGVRAVGEEFVRACYYVLWAPALLGLWWFRDRFRLFPGAWVMLLVSLAVLALMWRIASLLGYVSDRHLLLPLFCATYWAVAAVPKLAALPAAVAGRLGAFARLRTRLPAAMRPLWTAAVLIGFLATALPKTLEPLHANRSGFRAAGQWIAEHGAPWDEVIDPYSWSHYYSGKVFLEQESPAPPPGEAKACYVIIEESGHEHPRLPLLPAARDRAAQGHKVWSRTSRRHREIVDVVVYEAP